MQNEVQKNIEQYSEMSAADRELLLALLEYKKPRKVLEVGVSAGGTTAIMLQNLPKNTILYSNDISPTVWNDDTLSTGHIASSVYDSEKHATWIQIYGNDLAVYMDEIGGDIDFLILDTTHHLPGEFFSFITAFPYLSEGAVVFIHDISLHAINTQSKAAICNALLFNAIFADEKYLCNDRIPNAGALIIHKEKVLRGFQMILNMLFWNGHICRLSLSWNKSLKKHPDGMKHRQLHS